MSIIGVMLIAMPQTRRPVGIRMANAFQLGRNNRGPMPTLRF